MLKSIKKTLVLAIILAFVLILFPNRAMALVPLDGQFTATNACQAVVSIKKGTNPKNVRLRRGQTYPIIGKNNDPASHYLLEIANAMPSQRWVSASCGSIAGLPLEESPGTTPVIPVTPVATGKDYLLALSWEPAFCETKPDKIECKNLALNPSLPEATRFALHGLWPQPKSNIYCGVSKSDINFDEGKAWSKLPPVEEQLSPQTWKNLQAAMPGTASNLHRHEWTKHGTCYQGPPEEYFTEAIALLDAFNASPVQKLVASSIGKQLAIKDIDKALSSFGPASGQKIEVKCTNSVLDELWVNLEGNITLTTPVADLLRNSPPAQPEKFASCLIDDARD